MELIDFLMAKGRLDAVHRERVLALRRERGESESVIITRLGMIGEREMAECLAEFLTIPLAQSGDYPTAPLFPGDKPDRRRVSCRYRRARRSTH